MRNHENLFLKLEFISNTDDIWHDILTNKILISNSWLVQNMDEWPPVEPLPSYGRGRDALGGKYISLITGSNLSDVVIAGTQFLLRENKISIMAFKFIKKMLLFLFFTSLLTKFSYAVILNDKDFAISMKYL